MNKGNIKIIDILYWGVIACVSVFLTFNVLEKQLEEINIIQIETLIIMIPNVFLTFVFMTVISVFMLFCLTIPYVAVKIAYKMHKRGKLDKVDFRNDNYYTQLLPKYSIGVLSYIDDFSIGEKDVVATLLALELKNKIKIDNNIKIIDERENDLTRNEKYLFEELKNGDLNNLDINSFEKEIREDCKENRLLETAFNVKKKKRNIIILNVGIFIALILLFKILQMMVPSINMAHDIVVIIFALLGILIFIAMVIYPFVTLTSIIAYLIMETANPYIRTKEAKEINSKLEGLKKYIKDFSLMEQREKDDLVLWEQYLIYSVAFGINTKIVEDIRKKLV